MPVWIPFLFLFPEKPFTIILSQRKEPTLHRPTTEKCLGRAYPDVIRAFRRYTQLGLDQDRLPPYRKYERIRAVSKNDSEAASLLAVCDTLRILRLTHKKATLSAVRQVWMARPFALLGRQEISFRVRKSAFLLFCDDRTIYRYLHTAAELYRHILAENPSDEG
jgi:hypothetical protein